MDSNKDPRPNERFLWIEKYRKIKPIVLKNPDDTGDNKVSHSSARRSEITSGLEPYTGEWGDRQVAHLLHRALFGVKKAELDYFKTVTLEEAVDLIVSWSPLPSPPVNDFNGVDSDANDPHVDFGDSWLTAPHAGDKEAYRIISLKNWLIKNILTQQPTIHEKMVFFWSSILVTKVWDVYISKASYQYLNMLYSHALGNYKTLIKALTLDPSMLIFLNGHANKKEAPDENYARELQELFCIGKGEDSQYTEGDVQAAARILTGWTVNWEVYSNPGLFQSKFETYSHDITDKQFSAFYGNKVIEGKSGLDGATELDDLLDMIFENEETAKYICRRLYSFFVYNAIDEATEQNVISPLAEILRSNNYEVEPVLKTLFKSAHFYDSNNIGSMIKSPADHLLGVWRCLDVRTSGGNNILEDYRVHSSMLWHMANMGLEMGDPPNVAGWSAYYQAPQFDKYWITTDTITARALTTDSLLYWGFWITESMQIKTNILGLVSQLSDAANPNALLKEASLLLLGLELSDTMLNNLKAILLSGQQNDDYWASAWNAYINNQQSEFSRQIVETRLQATFQRLFQLGEYHLM